jgi:transposase
MGRRQRILTEILGVEGFVVREHWFERADGSRVEPLGGAALFRETRLVLVLEARWLPRCGECAQACRVVHEQLDVRRWRDLPWGEHPVVLVYAPRRARCRQCQCSRVELLPWAEPKQRLTRRLQQRVALEAVSMPILHVAILHGLSWSTVRQAEVAAIRRWERTRPVTPLVWLGVDEKYLGRRHRRQECFVTIVSNLDTGEPLWIGLGRSEAVLSTYLLTLPAEVKTQLVGIAMDMYKPYYAAVANTPGLEHVVIAHDPFHVMKRVGQAVDELRREVFFRAGPHERAVGRGSRWLLLRGRENLDVHQRLQVDRLLALNGTLARGYQIKEEMRWVLGLSTRASMTIGLDRVLRRTQRKDCRSLRRLHESLRAHREEILAFGQYHPHTGRIEALNNNWETLVRRSRGHRDLDYLLTKLRFMVANPLRRADDLCRFRALGVMPPLRRAA